MTLDSVYVLVWQFSQVEHNFLSTLAEHVHVGFWIVMSMLTQKYMLTACFYDIASHLIFIFLAN